MSDDEYQRLLDQLPQKIDGVVTWKKYFERLIHAGRRTGRTDIEIGNDIRNKLRGQLDDRTVRRYLPLSMKHEEKVRDGFADKMSAAAPYIPPLSHTVKEAQIIPEQQPPPRPPPKQPIKFNTDTFRRELRIALINGDTVLLYCNDANEVIEIKER